MANKVRYRKRLLALLIGSLLFTAFYSYYYIMDNIPDKIHLVVNKSENFDFLNFFQATVIEEAAEAAAGDESNIPKGQLRLSNEESLSISSDQVGSYQLELSLFGLLHIKNIDVEVVTTQYLYPGGMPIGIYLEDNGIMVIGTSEISSMQGVNYEPAYGIVKSGDYITAINGEIILGKSDMIEKVNKYGNNPIILTIRRNNEEMDVKINAVQTAENEFKLGIWVRDDAQGIGTLSYLDMDGGFGALGHGISDTDTGELVEVTGGTLYETEIRSVEKGQAGKPGSMSGIIYYQDSAILGTIETNTEAGIFGTSNDKLKSQIMTEPIAIGYRQDVREGDAVIRCNVNGEMHDYNISIIKVDSSNSNKNKGMVIQVVDESLLEITGGIVQGMSGSPIIQDNKMIGAVTHVFIQDSTKGYGIFIENMLQTQKNR